MQHTVGIPGITLWYFNKSSVAVTVTHMPYLFQTIPSSSGSPLRSCCSSSRAKDPSKSHLYVRLSSSDIPASRTRLVHCMVRPEKNVMLSSHHLKISIEDYKDYVWIDLDHQMDWHTRRETAASTWKSSCHVVNVVRVMKPCNHPSVFVLTIYPKTGSSVSNLSKMDR